MEESEKRRERLKAMRLEASNEVVSSSFPQQTLNSNLPPPLTNPLLQNEDLNSTTAATHRFDFYTDPMAAYSTDKRRPFAPKPHLAPSAPAHEPRNPEIPLSGAHQFQNKYAPHLGMYQGGDPYGPGRPAAAASPMGIRSPYPMNQGSPNFSTAPSRGHCFSNTPSPGPGCGGNPYPVYQGSPNYRFPPQGRGEWSNNSPGPGPGCGGGQWSNNSPGLGRGGGQWSNNTPSPGPGRGGGPSGGQWFNNSPGPGTGRGGGPSPSVGRGRGCWDGSRASHSSGFSGGRGRGRGYDQARSFYSKSMVEDPWESLTPVIWQGEKENDQRSFANRRGFFQKAPTSQKTPSAKKARVSNPPDASDSKKSLAEFLSESFDEAVEDAATV